MWTRTFVTGVAVTAFLIPASALPTAAHARTAWNAQLLGGVHQQIAQTVPASRQPKRSVNLTISGLPSGVKANVLVTGPKKYRKKVVRSKTIANLVPGTYKVRTSAVTVDSATYRPRTPSKRIKVKKSTRARFTIRYTAPTGTPGGVPTGTPGGVGPTPGTSPRPTFDKTIKWLPPQRGRVACESAPDPAPNELRLEVCDKEGISISSGSPGAVASGVLGGDASTSNLRALRNNGVLVDAVVSGNISARLIKVGPTGKTYIALTPVNLADTTLASDQCGFLEVDEATGIPTCVDNTIQNVAEVEFDHNGNVYYTGNTPSDYRTVLRKWNGSTVRNLTSEADLRGFVVMPDGYVVLSGYTAATGSAWTRLVSPSGSLSNIFSGAKAQFAALYPDGNVYMGMWGPDQFGIRRLLADSKTVDPVYWTGAAINNIPQLETYFPVNDFCTPLIDAFCGSFGTIVTNTVITQDGKVLVQAGSPGQGQVLMQYWPEVKYLTTSVAKVAVMKPADDRLFIAGTNASGDNIAALYDPTTNSEREVIGVGNQIEIYNASYSAAARKVFFDGLRFSDNQRVVGEVNVDTGTVNILGNASDTLTDLQAF